MIVSIKQIGGHDGSGESRLAPAAQCGVEGVDAAAVRSAWGICSQGGDVAWRERERRARLAQARTLAREREGTALSPPGPALPAQTAASLPQFLPVSMAQTTSPPAPVDIKIELRRGAAAMKITWPIAAAAECAAWMRELFIESRR